MINYRTNLLILRIPVLHKNQAEYISIAKYLFARCRTRIKRKIFKIDFSKVHRVPSSLSNSWEHSHMGKTCRKGRDGGGGFTWKSIYLVKKIKGKKPVENKPIHLHNRSLLSLCYFQLWEVNRHSQDPLPPP